MVTDLDVITLGFFVGSNTHNNNNPAGDGQAGDAGEGNAGKMLVYLYNLFLNLINVLPSVMIIIMTVKLVLISNQWFEMKEQGRMRTNFLSESIHYSV